MQVCPNCAKRLKDSYVYCRVCGTKLDGGNPGDFTTEMLNVFDHGDEFVYLFTDKGNQVVLKAGSMDELALMANEKNYPWEFRDSTKNMDSAQKVELVKTPRFETDFLRASSLQKPEIIPTSSAAKRAEAQKDESYVPDFEVSRVADSPSDDNLFKIRPRKNPNRQKRELSEDDISKEYGIRGVFKKDGLWAFRSEENDYDIVEKSLERLKDKVTSQNISWEITDENLAGQSFSDDHERIKRNDEEILKKRAESEEFWKEKNQIQKEFAQKRNDELKEKLANRNKDNLLR